ncbi:hypothetical protein OOT55_03050 [Marinimicrobium sp. C6131]|uniref:hypothetical protein n=1 Tax=Marinimicrobium sp. C6131 TaxID=3022676 RepID=UPI00223D18B1|nr:hypothetical protein [Marinimicrobium sp. C6131]UZJ45049.1 hypothetical protein OOT55_03050 [Marinimicrobium sp. C6131]
MHDGEQARARDHGGESDAESVNGAANESPPESSLLDLATAMVILIRQTWIDRWALFKAEARLAARSLALILLVSMLLAMTLVLVWVLLLAVASYLVWQAGVHWGWIAAGLLLAQGLMIIYLRGQLRRLLRWLRFPETRRAFERLASEHSSSETPSEETESTP